MCQMDDTRTIRGQTPIWKQDANKEADSSSSRETLNSPKSPYEHECLSMFAYGQEASLEKSSLSLRLMHKPPRSQNELEKACNPTIRNSLINAFTPQDAQYDSISPTDPQLTQNFSECTSPSDLTPSVSPTGFNLVRKKSGEIVKPLLKDRASSISVRSRSLPATPTYKQVHFGGDNDVRYFKKKDRPKAISAQSSPKPGDDDDEDEEVEIPSLEFDLQGDHSMQPLFDPNRKSYFEYYDEELNSHIDPENDIANHRRQLSKLPSPEDWQLELLNFSTHNDLQAHIDCGKQVFLENLFLSVDKQYLLGRIAVLNLAYEKSVNIRYSVDRWCTIVEIQTTHIPDPPTILKNNNYDRFMFKIPLDSFFNGFHSSVDPLSTADSELCSELCVKYLVNGQELWDNNQGDNYRFNLKKESKLKPQSTELPSAARTKPDAHKKRPKYSSSYLKKIKSDSALSKNMATISLEEPPNCTSKSTSPTSPDTVSEKSPVSSVSSSYNDFENNQYYLSSPLFSSLSKTEKGLDLPKRTSEDFHGESESGRTSPPVSKNYVNDAKLSKSQTRKASREFRPETDSLSLPRISRNLHEPMSYKDFLDSYCFFNSNLNDNSSKTTLVMSDGPSTIYNGRATPSEPNASSEPIYTVSSFLS